MAKLALIVALVLPVSAACSSGAKTPASALGSTEPIAHGVILVDRPDPGDWPQDRFSLHRASVAGDSLVASVSYSGGCEQHEFFFVASRRFLESEPPKVDTLLAHLDPGDPCDAIIGNELRFDLVPLREEYERAYGREHGRLVLLLQDREIPYTF